MYRDQDRDRDRDWSSRSKRRRRDHEYWVSGGILSRVSSAMALNAPYLLKLFLREKHAVQAIIGMLKSSVKAWVFGAAKLIGRLIINPDNEPFILPFGPQKCDLRESSLAKVESQRRNASNFHCRLQITRLKKQKINTWIVSIYFYMEVANWGLAKNVFIFGFHFHLFEFIYWQYGVDREVGNIMTRSSVWCPRHSTLAHTPLSHLWNEIFAIFVMYLLYSIFQGLDISVLPMVFINLH